MQIGYHISASKIAPSIPTMHTYTSIENLKPSTQSLTPNSYTETHKLRRRASDSDKQSKQANSHSIMTITAKHNRVAVGLRLEEWCVVYYEPIDPPDDVTVPHSHQQLASTHEAEAIQKKTIQCLGK